MICIWYIHIVIDVYMQMCMWVCHNSPQDCNVVLESADKIYSDFKKISTDLNEFVFYESQ